MRATKKSGEILEKYVNLVLNSGKFPTRTEIESKITSERQIRKHFDNITNLKSLAIKVTPEIQNMIQQRAVTKKPRILIYDIETSPIEAYVWGLFDQNIALNQIIKDWSVLSWSAKWLDDPPSKVMYMDTRNEKDPRDDKKILKHIWKLLDEADIIITQNGKKFDNKKLNARFAIHDMPPPSSYKNIDILADSKKNFAFTSHKLEYKTELLNTKYKKLKHKKFSGFDLWKECLKGNKEAWKEMEIYNKYDVLSTEENYNILKAWDTSINFSTFTEDEQATCNCGSKSFSLGKFFYTGTAKYQKYICNKCGSETRGRENLFTPEKKQVLRVGTKR